MATALILVAQGCEEIEVVTIVDVLRRAGVDITMAGLGSEQILGSHGIGIQVEMTMESVRAADFEMLIIPGGQPGTDNLLAEPSVFNIVKELNDRARYLAAICAAPLVFAKAGILELKKVTCYPSFHEEIDPVNIDRESLVLTDGNITTSQGPGTAMAFSLRLVEILIDEETAERVAGELLTDFTPMS